MTESGGGGAAARSAISQHLGVLAEVRLVVNHKEGRQRICSGEPAGMAQLRRQPTSTSSPAQRPPWRCARTYCAGSPTLTSNSPLPAASSLSASSLKVCTVESRVAFAAQQTLETWQRRGLEGTVKFGDQDMPANLAVSILSVEFLVHAWDFAVATNLSYELAPKEM